MSDPKNLQSLPELAVGILNQLAERQTEIACEFEQLKVSTPHLPGESGTWQLDGKLKISTKNNGA